MTRTARAAALMVALCTLPALAATLLDVAGTVRDASGRVVPGASVRAESAEGASAVTGADGSFRLHLPAGEQTLRIALPGFETATVHVNVSPETAPLDVVLAPAKRRAEDVVVQAIRADEEAPVTKTNLDLKEITRLNRGQEMPFLLRDTPSINYTSDSGTAAGYSYFAIRGVQQTRLNLTLDGAPLNDPEESALYFSNFGDFASSVGSIQVQRGVGTSTVGAATYGGSVNFTSLDPKETREFEGELGGGSFGTHRGAVTLQSGVLPGGFQVWGRASFQETDGFREHSGVKQRAFYFGISRQDESSVFKLSGFSGLERSELAYLATEESVLKENLRSNPLTPQETDHFGQDFVQASYTRFLGPSASVAAQVYYNGARGWFLIWDDAVAQTNLLKYSIDGHFVGGVATFHYDRAPVSFSGGVHYGDFTRDHFQDNQDGTRNYTNTGKKREADVFAKLGYDVAGWHLFADAQLRWARFLYVGDIDLGSVSWTFFNPKLGARRELSKEVSVYASVGTVQREPARSDLLAGEDNASLPYDLHAVKPEKVVDVEAGVVYRANGVELKGTLYDMEFRDEIAATGELNEIGLPLRRNVDRSYRRGIELEASWQALPELRLAGNANVSRNRIKDWTQFYDVYDADGNYVDAKSLVHHDVEPLLTPELLANVTVEWRPIPDASVSLMGRYQSRSQLDNTGSPAFRTPSFFNLDAALSLDLARWVPVGRPRVRLHVNNVLDSHHIWPWGYSYQYFTRDADGTDTLSGLSYYIPQATRAAFATVDVRF